MATVLLGQSNGCNVNFNYNNVLNVATGISIDNTSGTEPIKFFMSTLGVPIAQTTEPGASSNMLCSVAITLAGPSLIMTGVDSYGISSS